MKLTIELNDHDLKASIQKQLEAVVASVTQQLIVAKVNEIVDKKLARVSDSDLQLALTAAAETALDQVLGSRQGNTWHREQKIRSVIADAAITVLKNAKS